MHPFTDIFQSRRLIFFLTFITLYINIQIPDFRKNILPLSRSVHYQHYEIVLLLLFLNTLPTIGKYFSQQKNKQGYIFFHPSFIVATVVEMAKLLSKFGKNRFSSQISRLILRKRNQELTLRFCQRWSKLKSSSSDYHVGLFYFVRKYEVVISQWPSAQKAELVN